MSFMKSNKAEHYYVQVDTVAHLQSETLDRLKQETSKLGVVWVVLVRASQNKSCEKGSRL